MSWITSLLLQLPEGLLLIEKGAVVWTSIIKIILQSSVDRPHIILILMTVCAYSLTGDTVNAHGGVAGSVSIIGNNPRSPIQDTHCYDRLWCSTTVY